MEKDYHKRQTTVKEKSNYGIIKNYKGRLCRWHSRRFFGESGAKCARIAAGFFTGGRGIWHEISEMISWIANF